MLTVPASLMAIFLMVVLIPDVGLRMRHASYTRMIHAAEVQPEAQTGHADGDEHSEHDAEHPST